MTGRVRWTALALGAITAAYFVILYVPFILMAILGFQGPTGGPTFPMRGASVEWYRQLFGLPNDTVVVGRQLEQVGEPLVRSLMLAGATMVLSTSLALITSLAFRRRFRGSGLLFYFLLLGAVTPGLALGLGYALLGLEAGLDLRLLTTGLAAHVAWTFPFAFVVMLVAFNRFDTRVEEAAMTLGAPPLTTFRRVTLPLVFPGILTAALFSFTLSFDEYIRSQFAVGGDQTLPLKILAQLGGRVSPALYALGTLTTAVSIAVILLLLGSTALLIRRRTRREVAVG